MSWPCALALASAWCACCSCCSALFGYVLFQNKEANDHPGLITVGYIAFRENLLTAIGQHLLNFKVGGLARQNSIDVKLVFTEFIGPQ